MKVNALIIEDDTNFRELLARVMTLHGFQTRQAANGWEALKLIGEVQPNIILSDIHMPQMDGATLIDILQRDLATARIPVIFITGIQDPISIRDLAMRAAGFIQKPIKLPILMEMVKDTIALQAQTIERLTAAST
jgi:CheY-like chemotaxis protein